MTQDTALQVKIKNIMRQYYCPQCLAQHKGQACIYQANSDEHLCDDVPLHLKRLLGKEGE